MLEKSRIKIKNIAVCMYGQYRTGDACLEYIKKFYTPGDLQDVNIDFFCSLKPYETTYTRHAYNEKNNKVLLHQDQVSDDGLKHQTEQIFKYYNPKKFKVFTKEYEDQLSNIEASIIHSKVLSGWIEAIMLKSQYESENDMSYDLVIMQRYDAIIYPDYAFRSILNKLQDCNVATRGTFATSDKNMVLYQPIDFIRLESHHVQYYPNGQDMWIWGLGNALDIFAYDALEHIPSKHASNYSKHQYNTGYPHNDTHEMVGSVTAKMNIPSSMFPYLTLDGNAVLPLEMPANRKPVVQVAPIPIRTVYWEDGIIPELEKLSNKEIATLYDTKILNAWLKGE